MGGLSGGGGGGRRPGRGSRGTSRPARPGGNRRSGGRSGQGGGGLGWGLRGSESPAAPSLMARPRSCSQPRAGPVPAPAQPYCTARAGPGLAAGAYQVRRGESHPRSARGASRRAPIPPASPPPGPPGLELPDAFPVVAAAGVTRAPGGPPSSCLPLRPRLGTRRGARRLCRERSVTHPPLGVGGAGMGAPNPTSEPGSSGSGALAVASSLNSLPNPPQNPPGGRRET